MALRVVLLAGKGNSTKYIYNGIKESVNIESVLLCESGSRKKMIQRRIHNLGLLTVINQLLFQTIISKFIKLFSKRLIVKRKTQLQLNESPIPHDKVIEVGHVNSNSCIEAIRSINPDVIIVNGTSIISKRVLESTSATFINTHVGITPQYRGVHGGYWALRNKDPENFGVTVHKVDTGIDTGGIIYQDTTTVEMNDNFLTYPLYQYALAIPLLIKAITDIENDNLNAFKKKNADSKLYYHPTMTDYFSGWIKTGVK